MDAQANDLEILCVKELHVRARVRVKVRVWVRVSKLGQS